MLCFRCLYALYVGSCDPCCNKCYVALLGLYLYELLSYVVMPCCTSHTCMLCVCVTCIAMCGIRQPSCLFLVASLMGKCLLVLPLSHGSLLLLRNTWNDRHVSFFAPVSVPSGKCHAVSTGVLLACYSPGSLTAEQHVHC